MLCAYFMVCTLDGRLVLSNVFRASAKEQVFKTSTLERELWSHGVLLLKQGSCDVVENVEAGIYRFLFTFLFISYCVHELNQVA